MERSGPGIELRQRRLDEVGEEKGATLPPMVTRSRHAMSARTMTTNEPTPAARKPKPECGSYGSLLSVGLKTPTPARKNWTMTTRT
jgi:hypothetical protein